MMAKKRIVAWALIAPDGSYDVEGNQWHESAPPDYLGYFGVLDSHKEGLCKVVKLVAEVDLPVVEEVPATVEHRPHGQDR